MSLAWVKYVNAMVERIIKLNGKIYDLRKDHEHGKRSCSKYKPCSLRFSECEAMGMTLIVS